MDKIAGMGQDVGKGWDSKAASGKEALPDTVNTSDTGLHPAN